MIYRRSKRRCFMAAGWLVLLLLGVPPAQAATIVVTSDADDVTVNGNCTLREAIQAADTDAAVDGCPAGSGADTISFDAALTGATIQLTVSSLRISSDLTIDGAEHSITVAGGNTSGNIFRTLKVEAGATVTLIGLDLTDGYALESGGGIFNEGTLTVEGGVIFGNRVAQPSDRSGGGVFNAGTLTLHDSEVHSNDGFRGGGVHNAGTLTLQDSDVHGNSGVQGGGIYNAPQATASLLRSTIHTNAADVGGGVRNVGVAVLTDSEVRDNSGIRGGGIANGNDGEPGDLTVTSSVINGNDARFSGGGIWNAGQATLTGTDIHDNRVTTRGGDGGGGGYNSGDLLIIAGSVRGNMNVQYEANGGGLRNAQSGTLDLRRTLIAENESGDDGGGLSSSGNVTVTQSTITANVASVGGGLHVNAPGTVTLVQSTVSGNEAELGGGLYVAGGEAKLGGTIVSGNTAYDDGLDVTGGAPPSSLTSLGYNLIGPTDRTDAFAAPGDQVGVLDPRLGSPANNGGPTATMLLFRDSPALDASDPSVCGPFATDQRGVGFPRVIDSDGDGTATCDVGAFESPGCNTNVDQAADDGTPGTLRAAIQCAAPGATITFAASLDGQAILLAQGPIDLDDDLTIDSGGQNIIINAQNASGVVRVAPEATVVIDGVTLTGGEATDGGGVVNLGTLTLRNGTVADNRATMRGGGIFNEGTFVLDRTLVKDNHAVEGGGIANVHSAELLNATMRANTAQMGGGVFNDGTLTLTRTLVEVNSSGQGGGVFSRDILTMAEVAVRGNQSAQDGGGVLVEGGTAMLTATTLSGNVAQRNGGGLLNRASQGIFPGSGQKHNVQSGAVTLDQSTISGNWAGQDGGGLYAGGPITSAQATVSGNEASTGSGVFIDAPGGLAIGGTLIAGNAPVGDDLVRSPGGGGLLSDGFNIIGTHNLPSALFTPSDRTGVGNPHLRPLGGYGGPTETMPPVAGSPALDASDASVCGAFTTDQRGVGFPRVHDGDGDGTATCDAGATEAREGGTSGGVYAMLFALPPGHLPPPATISTLRAPVAGADDFDKDGVPDIVVENKDPQGNSTLTAFTAEAGTEVWMVTSSSYDCWPQNGTLRGFLNTDDDPNVEAIIGGEGTLIIDTTTGKADFCLDDTYRHLAEQTVDGNGTIDLIVVDTQTRQIQAWGWQ